MTESSTVVTNSGPVIALATVNQTGLLGGLYGKVLVPAAVFRELTWLGTHRPGAAEIEKAVWAQRVDLDIKPDPLLLEDLGAGEAEAITLAAHRSAALLLLDDRRARRIAEVAYHLRVKGVAGILVAAKRKGLVGSVRAMLLRIRDGGYFLADAVIERAAHEAGED